MISVVLLEFDDVAAAAVLFDDCGEEMGGVVKTR